MIFLRRSFFSLSLEVEMPDSSVSNFVLHTTYEMPDSSSEGFNSVKNRLLKNYWKSGKEKLIHAE